MKIIWKELYFYSTSEKVKKLEREKMNSLKQMKKNQLFNHVSMVFNQ